MKRTLEIHVPVKPEDFAHVVLRTRSLAGSIAWYETVLGMRVVHQNAFIAFLTYDEEHHRLALVETSQQDPAPPNAAGLDHFAYSFASLGDLLGTYQRLKRLEILPTLAINHGPTTSLYYRDPDGNGIEFQVNNFATAREAYAFMESEVFRKNPIGVVLDPDRLTERYIAGDPENELMEQGIQ